MSNTTWPPDDDTPGERLSAESQFAASVQEYRNSVTAIEAPFGESWMSRALRVLRSLDPRLQLMAAGCLAAPLGYTAASWGCDVIAAKPKTGVYAEPRSAADDSSLLAPSAELPAASDGSRIAIEPEPNMAPPLRAAIRSRSRRELPARREASGEEPSLTATNRPAGLPAQAPRHARPLPRGLHSPQYAQPEYATDTAAPDTFDVQPSDAPAHEEREPVHAADELRRAPSPMPAAAAAREAEAPRERSPADDAVSSTPDGRHQPLRVGHVAIDHVTVHGSLPRSVLRHGLERLHAEFARCHVSCGGDDSCESGPWHTETLIDETGRSRGTHVHGPANSPQTSRCLARATGKLSVPAPDTGTVGVAWDLQFTR
jgi:hypothetical protein